MFSSQDVLSKSGPHGGLGPHSENDSGNESKRGSNGALNSPIVGQYLEKTLFQPLEEFLARPKKGIRAELVHIGYRLGGGREAPLVDQLCSIIEAIHAGSLIVDDIQDGSVERRGRPSLHVLQGVPRAINAGNWLYFWALQKVDQLPIELHVRYRLKDIIQDMLFAGHLGQALDLGNTVEDFEQEKVPEICFEMMRLKAGALTGSALLGGWCLARGAVAADAGIYQAGQDFGTLLQMLDDLKNLKCGLERSLEFHSKPASPEGRFQTVSQDSTHGCAKRYEDLHNRRPNFLWAFAAQEVDARGYQKLIQAFDQLPDLKAIFAWIEEYDFVRRGREQAEQRFHLLCDQLNQKTFEPALIRELNLSLEKLYRKLVSAYEKY